jgi:hypothetical protein
MKRFDGRESESERKKERENRNILPFGNAFDRQSIIQVRTLPIFGDVVQPTISQSSVFDKKDNLVRHTN